MNPERERAIERICQEALERPRGERETFVTEACQSDAELRREVERLLANDSAAADVLSKPALAIAARDMATSGAALPVGQQIGSYRIVSSLGAGGMDI